MFYKYFILLLFLTFVQVPIGQAQELVIVKELKDIDELIERHEFNVAKRKCDSLQRAIELTKAFKRRTESLLEIEYRQALILDRANNPPTEPLRILLNIIDRAENDRLFSLTYRCFLLIALCYEKADEFELTKLYLNRAKQLYSRIGLEELYSAYCIRKSSYFRYLADIDSMHFYAKHAKQYAEKHGNQKDLIDSYILLGIVANRTGNYEEGLKYASALKDYRKLMNDTVALAAAYNAIAIYHQKSGSFRTALRYNDSAKYFFDLRPNLLYNTIFPKTQYEIYEALGELDSALVYHKKYQFEWNRQRENEELLKAKELEEKYQNEKKEAIIQNKHQQVVFVACLLGLIVFGSILLIRNNRKIRRQNQIISAQLIDLTKTLEQKQILLSELQHRVKNNLQHVISILEIQKESVDFNNIDELIRGNQNRIHSMALLHKKLNVSDHVNEVDLKMYLAELADLVKYSYENQKKKISLTVQCEIASISLEKALSIGLIIVELVSNSMKHAFNKQNIGVINIDISKKELINQLSYSDNGSGFDFFLNNTKGLGQEIIKGLIDQLDGKVESKNVSGFELIVKFK